MGASRVDEALSPIAGEPPCQHGGQTITCICPLPLLTRHLEVVGVDGRWA